MKLPILILSLLVSGAVLAEGDAGSLHAADPVLERLQSLQQMRMRLEQDWAAYLNGARANTPQRPVQPGDAPDVRQMRQDVTHNLERLEDRFRCLDVDLNGNNGNVVLICGDNQGPIATNNQQAFGADLSVGGGGQ